VMATANTPSLNASARPVDMVPVIRRLVAAR
jgi:hypothetical protein